MPMLDSHLVFRRLFFALACEEFQVIRSALKTHKIALLQHAAAAAAGRRLTSRSTRMQCSAPFRFSACAKIVRSGQQGACLSC